MSLLGKDWRKPRKCEFRSISNYSCFSVQKYEGVVKSIALGCPGSYNKDGIVDLHCESCEFYRRRNDEDIKTIARELRSDME